MYSSTTGTFLQRDPLGQSENGILEYSHGAITEMMQIKNDRRQSRAVASEFPFQQATRSNAPSIEEIDVGEKQNLYAYVVNNPVNFVDPYGLYATPGYGHFCGPRSGQEWDGKTPLDCLDTACLWHDECVGTLDSIYPGKLTYCDQMLSIKAYYCLIFGCDTAACRTAATIIGIWMAVPGGGTCPIGPSFK
ncbi:MAG: hypothetical protein JWP89_5220 [Schlesneria sp.]|nr:hypothetical protein [Schlesneria sp.]